MYVNVYATVRYMHGAHVHARAAWVLPNTPHRLCSSGDPALQVLRLRLELAQLPRTPGEDLLAMEQRGTAWSGTPRLILVASHRATGSGILEHGVA